MEAGANPEPKQGNWWQRLPTWAKWAIGVVAAFLLMGVGAAIAGTGEEDELKDEVASLERSLADTEADRDDAVGEAAELLAEQDEAIEAAEEKADRIVGDARDEADSLGGAVADAKQELKATESQLSAVEGELGGAEERLAMSEITDGVWQLEVDYVAGTYRAPGGGGCYWEKLSSPSGEFDAIIANGGFEKNQILTIDSPYFSTSGCGTWELVE